MIKGSPFVDWGVLARWHRPVTMLFIAVVLKLGCVFGLSSNKGTSSLPVRLTTHSRQPGRSNNFVCTCSAQGTS